MASQDANINTDTNVTKAMKVMSSASSEDEGLDDNQSGYTGPVTSMFGHLKGLQTNKVDEMDASDNADTSTQLQGNERNDSQVQFQKYPKGSLVIKTFDSDEISGFVKSFDTQTGVYTVQWSDDTEDLLTEFPMKHLIVESTGDDISKQKWIPCKDQHVYVKVGKTLHEARIESAIPKKPGHVVVRWDINNKTETVDLKDVTPMFQQRKRIKQAPKLSSSQVQALKTSPTKRVPKTYSTPIDLLKGMSKKGKNMVLCNKPTRIKCKVESGHVPLEHNFRHYLRSKLCLLNEQIHVPLTSFALDGEIDYDQLLEGTNSLLDCGNLPAKSMESSPMPSLFFIMDVQRLRMMLMKCKSSVEVLMPFLTLKKIQASSCPAFHKCQYQLLSC